MPLLLKAGSRRDRKAGARNASANCGGLASEIFAHPGCRRLQQFEPAAADDQFRAEFDEAARHRGPEPRAAAGDQDPLSRQQAFFKHRLRPLRPP